eukprot:scaffold122710_cov37-Tisochrysis_lutea.AAC.1
MRLTNTPPIELESLSVEHSGALCLAERLVHESEIVHGRCAHWVFRPEFAQRKRAALLGEAARRLIAACRMQSLHLGLQFAEASFGSWRYIRTGGQANGTRATGPSAE